MLALRLSSRQRIRPLSATLGYNKTTDSRRAPLVTTCCPLSSSSHLSTLTATPVVVVAPRKLLRYKIIQHRLLYSSSHNGTANASSVAPNKEKSYDNQRHYFSSVSSSPNKVNGSIGGPAASASVAANKTKQQQSSNKDDPTTSLSVEEQYSRKTPLEHILLRPGMYVGPCERLPPTTCWVLDPTPSVPPIEHDDTVSSVTDSMEINHDATTLSTAATGTATTTPPFRMVQKEFGLVPALIKIFDEILVNASDNRLRDSKNCDRLEVTIDPGTSSSAPTISIFNNGKGIPIQMHKDEQMYVPELVFGHLLSGSNFNDSTKRLTGGVHGLGAKLTNVFSTQFTVETLDSKRKLHYKQTWRNNMTAVGHPEIVPVQVKLGEDFTKVTFVPDIPRLTGNPDQVGLDPNDFAVMCRRVVDVAGCHENLQVILNGQDVSMPSFLDYSALYRGKDAMPLQFEEINKRWQVGVGLSESGSFESVSFVNGMATHRGGTHVNAISNQIVKRLQEEVEKQCDAELAMAITPSVIRRNLFISVRSLIENPNFDSQMKEYLTSSPEKFGSKYTLSKQFLNKALVRPVVEGGPGIVEELIRVAQGRQQALLMREVGKKTSRRELLAIPKLEDAHKAGTTLSSDCTLILTEGDSAKSLAVAGLEVIGRDLYGVFPLRGKFLNVREAKVSQLTNNAEVKALVAILGLSFKKDYDTTEERAELRYGNVMLMTDQDNDGSHIKGLVINFFRHFWPNLLKPAVDCAPGTDGRDKTFLSSFVTPLLKATRKGNKEVLSFYSLAEYNEWRESLLDPSELKKWSIKYYKGLGTSTPAEAKEYFAAFHKHFRPYHWNSDMDGELVDMVFDKNQAAARRDWINATYDPEITLDPDSEAGNSVTYEDFINKEMIHFSNADNVRSLPNVVDGLKPSQRKVLYAAFKRNLKSEIKVAQLTGYCAEHTHYHHGEVSLQSTIIGLAQDFVGSNNINLLVPSGQFGTRLSGGKDAASPRYIFTSLSRISRYIFPEEDDILLNYLEDDGQKIEPEFYAPILPLLLINGSQGIGTGWSTHVPSYNPEDILNYIIARLDEVEDLPPIRPYARNFGGRIEPQEDGCGYVTYGRAKQATENSVLIDELPLGVWTDQYKQSLLKMRDRGEIMGFVENHTTTKVSFEVKLSSAKLQRIMNSATGLEGAFKLKSKLSTMNMHAFDANSVIHKYKSAEEIADAFFAVRMALYHDRKSVLESEMKHASVLMKNKANFIRAVVDGEIDLISGRQSKAEIVDQMKTLKFASASDLDMIRNDNTVLRQQEDEQDEENDMGEAEGRQEATTPIQEFDYLLNMALSNLTSEKITQLQDDAARKEQDLEAIQKRTPSDLWRADLEKLAPLIEKMKLESC